jgi:hypothetical protein
MNAMRHIWRTTALVAALAGSALRSAGAQGVTSGSIVGKVTGQNGSVTGARITAVHEPSGTRYEAITRAEGRFTIPAVRVGGPYTVSAIALGFEKNTQQGLEVTLGTSTDIVFEMKQAVVTLSGVQVTATGGALSSRATGATTTITSQQIAAFPTIGRTLTDFVRLTPQSGRNGSFAGQDNRLNNITLDGSYFNNSFGLGSAPGVRTGVSPIPIDAIEQLQVNIAPFDVRQGNFTGAGVNAVTKSGTNQFKGAVYYTTRNQGLVGDSTAGLFLNKGTFKFSQPGGFISGPIIKNKLFFFLDYETDELTQPGNTWFPNTGSQALVGNQTRVLSADLDGLSTFLSQKFNYNTGPYVGWDLTVPSSRYIGKLDWNINDRNKFSFRYSRLESSSDVPISNSNALGFGNRRDNQNSMSFQNAGYAILENSDSWIGELNSQFGNGRFSNQVIAGFTTNNEDRKYKSDKLFPLVDILNNGTNYISFGFEPFTPANQLRYKTWQFQDNVTGYFGKHELTAGVTFQKYNSRNVFFPGSQGVYTYNSLADFYADANGYLANPNRTTAPVTLRRFEVRYNNIPGNTEPVQPLQVLTYGAYLQDEWRPTRSLKVTLGARFDLPVFENTAYNNAQANALSFRDQDGQTVQYNTGKMPNANVLISPRVGFNWDVMGDRSTVLRGGTGVFSGTPPYVWVSNQVGNTGVLTGFEQTNTTTARPFNPNPDAYKPTTVTGAPAASYELNVTSPDYKFAQQWRTNLAVDQKLPWGIIGTLEGIYGREMNGPYYINANLPAAQSKFTGADQRPRWTANRINSNVTANYVISNATTGYNYNLAASLTKNFANGLVAKTAYSYGIARNSYDPGSTAATNWTANGTPGDPNNPGLGFSDYTPGKRLFLALSYRKEYFKAGATTIGLFTQGATLGVASYTFSADANGDGATANDLVYVPRSTSEMNFQTFCISATGGVLTNCATATRTYTAADQAAAWDAYINQDPYLKTRRGQYAQRNGLRLPVNFRTDLGITQELFQNLGGQKNTLSLRLDILNLDNLINKKWGSAYRVLSNQPLIPLGADANGALAYRLRNIGQDLVSTTFQHTAGLNTGDTWRMQLGVRYTFN